MLNFFLREPPAWHIQWFPCVHVPVFIYFKYLSTGQCDYGNLAETIWWYIRTARRKVLEEWISPISGMLLSPVKQLPTSIQYQCFQWITIPMFSMDYNTNVFNGLKGILNDFRLFNHALLLAEQILHTVAGHKYPEECLRALPDLQHCAYCGGYSNPKPCLNFCLNTMRGCFANIATLKDEPLFIIPVSALDREPGC